MHRHMGTQAHRRTIDYRSRAMARWAITGGAGFLGLHLARRLVADGQAVRVLDVVPLDDAPLAGAVEELRGDVRDAVDCARLVAGVEIVVHAAAALPILASRDAIRSVNVDGTATALAAAAEAGVRRVVFISSTAVYGVPEKHPIVEDDPLVGVGHYGQSKIDAEEIVEGFARRGLEGVVIRPKTFLGPERLGVFEILFDWIREGRRIPILGDGSNRYQLLAVEDLVEAVVRSADAPVSGEALNVGAKEFGTVRTDLEALVEHAGSGARLRPIPSRPAELVLRALELLRLSPLAEWHYRTAHKDSFVDVSKAERLLGWTPRLSNEQALVETYDWYLANRSRIAGAGVTHRVPWNQRALRLVKRFS
jgi:nucleoside-diphosphate-sugar epimerase